MVSGPPGQIPADTPLPSLGPVTETSESRRDVNPGKRGVDSDRCSPSSGVECREELGGRRRHADDP